MMKLKILCPGKTRNKEMKFLQEFYLARVNQLEKCELIQTKEAKGIAEKYADRIKEIEAVGLEKHFKSDYIICLIDEGKKLESIEFTRLLKRSASTSSRYTTFVLGGFLGLEERILKRADFLLSLSQMTFSHELSRVMLLEQIYRSLTILKGIQYAK